MWERRCMYMCIKGFISKSTSTISCLFAQEMDSRNISSNLSWVSDGNSKELGTLKAEVAFRSSPILNS